MDPNNPFPVNDAGTALQPTGGSNPFAGWGSPQVPSGGGGYLPPSQPSQMPQGGSLGLSQPPTGGGTGTFAGWGSPQAPVKPPQAPPMPSPPQHPWNEGTTDGPQIPPGGLMGPPPQQGQLTSLLQFLQQPGILQMLTQLMGGVPR